mmetsp:Transcript_28873/g.61951  ORF Transcript_28873/g.61951 Transcript_28873/m.61951 type:complete len:200 (+) Transcript_28873:873-1472(+)
MRVCKIGAHKSPPLSASKLTLSSRTQSQGYMPMKSELISTRRSLNATSASLISMALGVKKRPKSATRRQPIFCVSGVSSTTDVTVSRAWYNKGAGSCFRISGTSSVTSSTVSVTINVFDSLWRKTVSENAPSLLLKGPSVKKSNVSVQSSGASSVFCGIVLVLEEGYPRNGFGRFTGNEYWPGASQTSAVENFWASTPA